MPRSSIPGKLNSSNTNIIKKDKFDYPYPLKIGQIYSGIF